MKSKTVHVILRDGQWAVAGEGRDSIPVFPTQREAVESAKIIVKGEGAGQVVVHGRDGRVRDLYTYGMPPILDPPGKKSVRIEKAVDKITLARLGFAPPPRG